MALVQFENLPSTNTAINSTNLNNNFNYTNPVGAIIQYAGSTAPTGYLICDGSAISRTDYADLFTAIGTTYGVGNGSTTFNLPNLKGRVAVGYDNSQTEFNTLGKTGGEKTHTLTINEMPSHGHGQKTSYEGGVVPFTLAYGGGDIKNGYWHSSPFSYEGEQVLTENVGGGQAHNILQPYAVLNYIIKY